MNNVVLIVYQFRAGKLCSDHRFVSTNDQQIGFKMQVEMRIVEIDMCKIIKNKILNVFLYATKAFVHSFRILMVLITYALTLDLHEHRFDLAHLFSLFFLSFASDIFHLKITSFPF